MAYIGEDIPITILGDATTNLDELDFKVVLYPHDNVDAKNSMVILKTQMTREKSNVYSGKVPYTDTLIMPPGYYTLEILTIGEDSRRIFRQEGIFTLYDSVSKTL